MREPNTWQHFLPVSYLKQFSPDQTRGRRSQIHVFHKDGDSRVESCESQCARNNFYSASRKMDENKFFELLDDCLPKVTRSLLEGRMPSVKMQQRFLRAVILLHLRNPAIMSRGTGERLAYLNHLERVMWGQIIANVPADATTPEIETAVGRALKNWQITTVRAVHDCFVTCDNPAILFRHSNDSRFLGLPLAPNLWAFLFDATKLVVGPPQTGREVQLLNEAQAFSARNAVYSRNSLPQGTRVDILRAFGGAYAEVSYFDDLGVQMRSIDATALRFIGTK